jgi:alkylated DNA repair dioxygenase AlkB
MYKFKEIDNSESIFYYNDTFLSEEEQKDLFSELDGYEMEVYPNSTRQMLWLDKLNRPYNFSRVKLKSSSLVTPTIVTAEHNIIKPNIEKLTKKINNFINTYFNKTIGIEKEVNYTSILINKYCGKYSGVGWHSDNEKCIPENSIIVSISIGDERDFEIKRMTESEREFEYKKLDKKFIKNENEKYEMHRFKLKSGSIFIMAGSAQNFWYHQLPKYKHLKDNHDIRYNLTFREYI